MTGIKDNIILPFSSSSYVLVPPMMVLLLFFVVGTQGFTSNIFETMTTTAPSSLHPRHRHRHPFLVVRTSSSSSSSSSNDSVFRLFGSSSTQSSTNAIASATTSKTLETEVDAKMIHPAVAGWPEKYKGSNKSGGGTYHVGPRKISDTFDVVVSAGALQNDSSSSRSSSEQLFKELDVENWPTWTTSDKPKWQVGNVVQDKVMPYNELSYVISGKLRIEYSSNSNISDNDDDDDRNTAAPTTTNTVTEVVIGPGEFVTFPKDFCATWEVLEELTWYYYLY